MLMTPYFVCTTLNFGRKKSTGTEPKGIMFHDPKPIFTEQFTFCKTVQAGATSQYLRYLQDNM